MRRVDAWAQIGLLALGLSILSGCPTGAGDGAVVGRIYVLGCDGEFDFGAVDAPAFFDLRADFFVGEPILDDSAGQPRQRLDIRIQRGGNNIEDTDSLFLQLRDLQGVAELVAAGRGVPVGPEEATTAALLLYVTCPSFYGSLQAVAAPGVEACPTLSATETQSLCAGTDFDVSPDPSAPTPPFSVGQSCVVFCQLGAVRPGEAVPQDFAVDFGDVVSGLFFFSVTDPRLVGQAVEVCADGFDNDGDGAVDEADCTRAAGQGHLAGGFHFVVRRGQVAQEFP